MHRKLALLTLALALIAAPLAAEQRLPNLEQTRVNLSFHVPTFDGLAARLQGLAEKHQGQLTHMSLQSQSTSGSVNIKIAPDKLQAFLKTVDELGRLESQNISTSDNRQSYLDTKKRLDAYRAMAQVSSAKVFASLPGDQKALAREEYDRFVQDRIRSYENSLRSYEEQSSAVEISISFQQPQPKRPQGEQQQEQPEGEAGAEPAAQAVSGVDPTLMKGLYILGIVNLAFLWAFYRRFESSTEESN